MSETKVIAQIDRMQNSVNGNPRYRLHFSDGTSAVTKPDAMFAYAITVGRDEGKTVAVTYGKSRRYIESYEGQETGK